ncbi:bifunctional homocysteine S-methyltransferase/methylenetetrahydrofolate reductase [Alteribacter populi]|uniref:bifunctional homocysteine S-methyltransferase/methylenetetrahydrofolate reductase n=1 Tax=Alteribacter populi TaxID=2011011 RepID=UPI000BBB4EF9|nr:bifunctional homocysteine S-methyltransferase/methylenetetrahydrofolate reductase [Alteribacter populi]
MGFLQELEKKILIGDGAMGTLLYAHGVDRCFEELNLTHDEQISQIHRAYIRAGADLIQTNTYGANYEKLSRYGLEDSVQAINRAAVKIAKKAAEDQAYILGTIGGIRSIKKTDLSVKEITRGFREQLHSLLHEGVDGILLETYYDLEELLAVLNIVKNETALPVIAQLSLHEAGVVQGGHTVAKALDTIYDAGADIAGLNCRLGPHHMIQSFEEVPLHESRFLSGYPNASLPDYKDGRLVYDSNADYFQKSAEALRKQGVRLIGGCCGTTPEHIEAIAKAVKHTTPVTEKTIKTKGVTNVVVAKEREQHLHELVEEKKSVIVELDPPRKLEFDRYLKGTEALKKSGVDAITLADNSLASPRVCNMALGGMVQSRGVRPLIHITCRDRNLIGLQSHLMGLHALGMSQVLAVTGDPTKVGDFPGATSVYDLSSFELIHLIKQLNEGISFSGKSIGQQCTFSVAAAFNPNVKSLDKAVQRLERKINSGADYFITQPVYSEEKIIEVYEATKHLPVPIYLGVMPLTSGRNAEFLHHEVPGIKLTDEIRTRMHACEEDRLQGEREGIAISKSLIDTAVQYFDGIYLITPFLRYEMTVQLTEYINMKTGRRFTQPVGSINI